MPNHPNRTCSGSLNRSPNPTGRRSRGPEHFASEAAAAAFPGLPDGYNHHEIGDLLKAVGRRAGWTPALIDHFSLLLDWTQPQDWLSGAHPIVWLSVQETAERLNLSPSQVRRNERRMRDLGAIAWKDSSNHRRFGRRNDAGHIEEAWGVNLAPAAALLDDLRALERDFHEDRAERCRLKRSVAAARQSLLAAVDTAALAGKLSPEAAEAWRRLTLEAAGPTPATAPRTALERRLSALESLDAALQAELAGEAPEAGQSSGPDPEPDRDPGSSAAEPAGSQGNAAASGPPDIPADDRSDASHGSHGCLPPSDYPTRDSCSERNTVGSRHGREGEAVGESAPAIAPPVPTAHPVGVPENAFFDILPDRVRDWVHEPRPGWPDIVEAAALAAGGLGISDHAWKDACRTLGRREAAVAVSIVAIKHDQGLVRSPGGYLRGMTEKGAAGELNLAATIFGLQDRKRRSGLPGAVRRGSDG